MGMRGLASARIDSPDLLGLLIWRVRGMIATAMSTRIGRGGVSVVVGGGVVDVVVWVRHDRKMGWQV